MTSPTCLIAIRSELQARDRVCRYPSSGEAAGNTEVLEHVSGESFDPGVDG